MRASQVSFDTHLHVMLVPTETFHHTGKYCCDLISFSQMLALELLAS